MTSSESAASTIASSSSSGAGTSGGESGSGFQVPLTHDDLTFGARQEVRLKEIEKKVDEELETQTVWPLQLVVVYNLSSIKSTTNRCSGVWVLLAK